MEKSFKHILGNVSLSFSEFQSLPNVSFLLPTVAPVKSGMVAISFTASFQPISRLEVEWFNDSLYNIYIYMWISRKKSVQFPCRSSPKNPEAYILAHIPSPFSTGHLGRYSKSSRCHHPRDDWRMDIHLGFWELPRLPRFPRKPHGTCPIHLGSWSFMAKNKWGNYLGCETAKLAKLKGINLLPMGIFMDPPGTDRKSVV